MRIIYFLRLVPSDTSMLVDFTLEIVFVVKVIDQDGH